MAKVTIQAQSSDIFAKMRVKLIRPLLAGLGLDGALAIEFSLNNYKMSIESYLSFVNNNFMFVDKNDM